MLLKDTNNGKIYKYRYFDNDGYLLDNLSAGTFHCASPFSFNDPFDYKIGITLSSIIQAKYETDEDFAKANGVTEDTNEIELTMLMSQKMYPEHEIARQDITNLINDKIFQINDKLVELVLICCLCTDYKN